MGQAILSRTPSAVSSHASEEASAPASSGTQVISSRFENALLPRHRHRSRRAAYAGPSSRARRFSGCSSSATLIVSGAIDGGHVTTHQRSGCRRGGGSLIAMPGENVTDHSRRVDALKHHLRVGSVDRWHSVGDLGCHDGDHWPVTIPWRLSKFRYAPLREASNHAYRYQHAAEIRGLRGDVNLRRVAR